MPYRRLPNTDNARIRALKTGVEKCQSSQSLDLMTIDVKKLETMLRHFESAQMHYRESLQTQASANRKFQKLIKNARLYISHFIQVLNLCVIRNEIKKESKSLYHLDPANATVPDLTNNDAILLWGDQIVKGEQARLAQGGTPIYNPTVARVNVAFSQFKEAYFAQKTYQQNTARLLEALSKQREEIDAALYTLWNQIEAAFAKLPNAQRLERCKEFGVVYYLRRGEKEQLNE